MLSPKNRSVSATPQTLFSIKIDRIDELTQQEEKKTLAVDQCLSTPDYDKLLAQLLEFLRDKFILNLKVGDYSQEMSCKAIDKDKTEIVIVREVVRFPDAKEIQTILDENKESEKSFKELSFKTSMAMSYYLIAVKKCLSKSMEINPVYKLLMSQPLRSQLNQRILIEIEEMLDNQLIRALSHGKTSEAKAILDGCSVGDVSHELLAFYLRSYAAEWGRLDVDLVRILINHGAQAEAKYMNKTALHWLFSRSATKIEIEKVKQVIELLLAKGANLETTCHDKTAYHIADQNDYPREVLELVCPPSMRVKSTCVML